MQEYTLVLLLEVQLDNLYLNLFKIVKIIFIFHVVDISFFCLCFVNCYGYIEKIIGVEVYFGYIYFLSDKIVLKKNLLLLPITQIKNIFSLFLLLISIDLIYQIFFFLIKFPLKRKFGRIRKQVKILEQCYAYNCPKIKS